MHPACRPETWSQWALGLESPGIVCWGVFWTVLQEPVALALFSAVLLLHQGERRSSRYKVPRMNSEYPAGIRFQVYHQHTRRTWHAHFICVRGHGEKLFVLCIYCQAADTACVPCIAGLPVPLDNSFAFLMVLEMLLLTYPTSQSVSLCYIGYQCYVGLMVRDDLHK